MFAFLPTPAPAPDYPTSFSLSCPTCLYSSSSSSSPSSSISRNLRLTYIVSWSLLLGPKGRGVGGGGSIGSGLRRAGIRTSTAADGCFVLGRAVGFLERGTDGMGAAAPEAEGAEGPAEADGAAEAGGMVRKAGAADASGMTGVAEDGWREREVDTDPEWRGIVSAFMSKPCKASTCFSRKSGWVRSAFQA